MDFSSKCDQIRTDLLEISLMENFILCSSLDWVLINGNELIHFNPMFYFNTPMKASENLLVFWHFQGI